MAWTSPLNCLLLSVHSLLLGQGSAVFSHNYLVSLQKSLPVRWPSSENLNGHGSSHEVLRINKYRYSPFDLDTDVCLCWKEQLQSGFLVNNHIDCIPNQFFERLSADIQKCCVHSYVAVSGKQQVYNSFSHSVQGTG